MSRINFNSGGRSSPVSFISRYFPLLLIAGVIIYLFVSGNLSKVISTITNTFSNLFSKSGSAVDSLMQNVGVFDSNADKAAKAAIGDSKSPWSPSFYQNSPSGSHLFTRSTAESLAKQIYDSWGFFAKDFNTTMSAIKQCKYRTQVSYLADVFSDKYSRDLVSFIRPAKFTLDFRNYPSNDQFEAINNYVNSLP